MKKHDLTAGSNAGLTHWFKYITIYLLSSLFLFIKLNFNQSTILEFKWTMTEFHKICTKLLSSKKYYVIWILCTYQQ